MVQLATFPFGRVAECFVMEIMLDPVRKEDYGFKFYDGINTSFGLTVRSKYSPES